MSKMKKYQSVNEYIDRSRRLSNRTSAPDLLVIDLLELSCEILAVCFATVELQGFASLCPVTDGLVESFEDG